MIDYPENQEIDRVEDTGVPPIRDMVQARIAVMLAIFLDLQTRSPSQDVQLEGLRSRIQEFLENELI